MKIGVFDSGLGGLTVLKELIKKHPYCEYFYFGDNLNVPYGNKSKEELKMLVDRIIKFLLTKEVDIIVVACGTVSSNLYDELDYGLPIYDIITTTVDYINESKYKKIGVIATEKTIESNVFNNRIEKEVISAACPLLATYIEDDLNVDFILKEYLKVFNKIDALVLGCTHYPLVSRRIERLINADIINMGKILSEKIYIKDGDKFSLKMYFTKVNDNLIKQVSNIINEEYEIIEVR